MNDVLVDAERFDSTNGGWGALEEECGGGPSNWPLFLVCILPIFFGAREYEVYEDGTFGGTNLDDCFLRDPNQSVGWTLHRNPYYTRIHRHHTVLTLEFDACTWSPVSKWRRRIRPPTMRDRQIVGRTTTPDGKREWPLPRLGAGGGRLIRAKLRRTFQSFGPGQQLSQLLHHVKPPPNSSSPILYSPPPPRIQDQCQDGAHIIDSVVYPNKSENQLTGLDKKHPLLLICILFW